VIGGRLFHLSERMPAGGHGGEESKAVPGLLNHLNDSDAQWLSRSRWWRGERLQEELDLFAVFLG
jgi:hypothetical protein